MIGIIYKLCFSSCICTPKQKYHRFFSFIEQLYNVVGKFFPSGALMAVGCSLTDSENIIQKKYSAFGPVCQFPVFTGIVDSCIAFYFLKYIYK